MPSMHIMRSRDAASGTVPSSRTQSRQALAQLGAGALASSTLAWGLEKTPGGGGAAAPLPAHSCNASQVRVAQELCAYLENRVQLLL